jgi:hypothetical protein
MDPRHRTEPDSPDPAALTPILTLLVFQQGTEVECSGSLVIRQLHGMHFVSPSDGAWMRGPYPDLPAVFATEGRMVLETARGRILEWESMVLSLDQDGGVAGPYASFDEWLWMEGEPLLIQSPKGSAAIPGGYVHHWNGHYFISVDPFPASSLDYPSRESALRAIGSIGRLLSPPRRD